jgi:transposase InsO family protein
MADNSWIARPRPVRRSLTRQAKAALAAPDRVGRTFWAARPDQLWCGDVTYIPTAEGFVYLLVTVLDLCSRRLLGYAFSNHHDADLTEAALQMAVTTRIGEGRTVRGVVFHSVEAASTPRPRSRPPAPGWASHSRWAGSGPRWTTPLPRP